MNYHDTPLIAHVIFRLDVGGLENGLVNLINGLPEERFRHVIICIDEFTDFQNRIRRDDVEVVAIHKRPGTDLSALWRLCRTFRRLKPDIVHTRNIAALDALLPAFLAGVRIRIHSEHGWNVDDLDANNRKLRLLRKLHSPLVSRYVALSSDLASYLRDFVGIDESRITQIYNGVDEQKFRPREDRQVVRESLGQGFSRDSILIGTVGRLQAVKDQLNLATAFVELLERAPDLRDRVKLVIVGDGDLRQNIIQKLDDAGICQQCWLPGSRDDVLEILQALDIFVLPSLAEGISNTILEAMGCALPIIATDVGGNPELVQHGKSGTIVPRADATALAGAMEVYVRNRDMALAHGQAGRVLAEERFNMSGMLRNYLALYVDLLNSKN